MNTTFIKVFSQGWGKAAGLHPYLSTKHLLNNWNNPVSGQLKVSFGRTERCSEEQILFFIFPRFKVW
jgi:hypothetical protein